MKNKTELIGWLGSLLGTLMFLSYSDQIRLNIAGHPGSIVMPIATALNCTVWILYGYKKIKKDWPIIMANAVGLLMAVITVITASI